jgi:lipopolysaccharide export LptBFGC system permease protein LptF
MKRLDRYILASFFKDYVVASLVLVGLYVVMDAMLNFEDFAGGASGSDQSLGEVLASVATYYGSQALFVYGQLAGVIPVAAAAFTFMRMSRFNEMTALLAAGVPLLRVAAPVVVAAVGMNLVLQPVNQELVVPRLAGWLLLDHDEAATGEAQAFAVRAMPTNAGGIFDAAEFRPGDGDRPATATGLTVIERPDEANQGMIAVTVADSARWDATLAAWVLEQGRRATGLAVEPDRADVVIPPTRVAVETWSGGLTPADVALFRAADVSVGAGGTYFDLLSTRQLNALLNRPDGPATAGLLRAKHARLSSYAMNLVFMLLAVPAVLTRQPGQLRQAAGKTLAWVGTAMAAVFLCQMIARDPPVVDPAWAARWPAILTWLPVFVFGPVAVWLLDRMES